MLIETLASKNKEIIKLVKNLQEQNNRLTVELAFHKKENEKNRKSLHSYESLKKDVEMSVFKIEKLLQKIDTSKEQRV
jgi:site-specific DNA-adenine methylase